MGAAESPNTTVLVLLEDDLVAANIASAEYGSRKQDGVLWNRMGSLTVPSNMHT
jgi:hypothetical protein